MPWSTAQGFMVYQCEVDTTWEFSTWLCTFLKTSALKRGERWCRVTPEGPGITGSPFQTALTGEQVPIPSFQAMKSRWLRHEPMWHSGKGNRYAVPLWDSQFFGDVLWFLCKGGWDLLCQSFEARAGNDHTEDHHRHRCANAKGIPQRVDSPTTVATKNDAEKYVTTINHHAITG